MSSAKSIFFSILLMIPGGFSLAQDTNTLKKHYFIAGLRLNYGFIIAHTPAISEAAKSNPAGLQFDFSWHLNTSTAYSYCNCLPRLGISMHLWDYRNKSMLGYSMGLMAFAEPFFNLHHRLQFSIRPGFGLAWLSNPYDSLDNPSNLAYSTRIGYALLLNVNAYYRAGKHVLVNAGINYNHISNGGVKHPNKGLNYPTLSVGVEYKIHPGTFNRFTSDVTKNSRLKNRLIIAGLIGFKGLLIDNKTYLVYGLYAKYLLHLGRHSNLAGGLEFDSDQTKLRISEVAQSVDPDARYIVSSMLGYEHVLGRFSLTFDMGVYLRNPDQGKDLIFQRYGIKFHFTPHVFLGLNLKAHRNHAEFFDFRVGYTFFRKDRSISPNAFHME